MSHDVKGGAAAQSWVESGSPDRTVVAGKREVFDPSKASDVLFASRDNGHVDDWWEQVPVLDAAVFKKATKAGAVPKPAPAAAGQPPTETK